MLMGVASQKIWQHKKKQVKKYFIWMEKNAHNLNEKCKYLILRWWISFYFVKKGIIFPEFTCFQKRGSNKSDQNEKAQKKMKVMNYNYQNICVAIISTNIFSFPFIFSILIKYLDYKISASWTIVFYIIFSWRDLKNFDKNILFLLKSCWGYSHTTWLQQKKQ